MPSSGDSARTAGQLIEVAQGETIFSLASRSGHTWRRLWNHPANEHLRSEGRTPGVLLPGDSVFVPTREDRVAIRSTEQRVRVQVEPTTVQLTIKLPDLAADGRRPFPFVLTVSGRDYPGNSAPDGTIHVEGLPATAQMARLRTCGRDIGLLVGHLDPVTTVTGGLARLLNLGWYDGPVSGELDEEGRQAMCRFQRAHDVEPTGELDRPTQDALSQAHGS
jgi:hypothetical protein